MTVLHVLLVDDDAEALELLSQSLSTDVLGHEIRWDPCNSFDEAVQRVKERRYDIVVTDITEVAIGPTSQRRLQPLSCELMTS